MQAIVIPLRVNGIAQANRQINAMGQRIATVSKNAKIALQVTRSAGGGAVGSGGVGASVSPAVAALARTQRIPASLLPKPAKPPALPPPLLKQIKAAPTFNQKLNAALMSSRVGAGGIMPLVSKLVPLLGAFALPIMVATAGLKALADITMQAAENLKAFRSAMLTGGGSAQETAVGRALGDSNGQMAREFARTISQGGIAAGYAARSGISDPGGELFGNTNKTQNLLKWAEALRKMSDVDATRAARATGTEELLKIRDLSKRAFDQLKATAKLQGDVNSPDKIRAAANFNAQLDNAKMHFESLTNIIGSQFIKAATPLLEMANGLLGVSVKIGNSAFGKALMNIFLPILGQMGAINDAMNPQNKESATRENTDALRELAQTLRNGVYGGGPRARSAIPAQWSGYNADQWAKQAMNLGAFTL